ATDLVHLNTEASRLLLLLRIHRGDADLNEPLGQLFFHDAREGRSVGVAIALEVVVEIRMRVEMDNGEILEVTTERPNNWIGNGVVAAEADWALALGEECLNGVFDFVKCVFLRELEITGVLVGAFRADINAQF